MRYSKGKMLKKVQTLAFTVHEIVLYLDGHPKCKKALEYYKKYNEMLLSAKKEYEECYGPLTQNGVFECDEWTWIKGPWPWQYEANIC